MGTIKFNKFVQPACLPFGKEYLYKPGTKAIVSGWGALSEGGQQADILQAAEIVKLDFDRCNEIYKEGYAAIALLKATLGADFQGGKSELFCESQGGRWLT